MDGNFNTVDLFAGVGGLSLGFKMNGFNNVFANDVRSLPSPKLSEAMQLYLQLKGVGKAKTFQQAAIRNVGVVIEVIGD